MKIKLQNVILDFTEKFKDVYFHETPLLDLARESGHKFSTIARTCRLMANEGLLERLYCNCANPKHVVYKFKSRVGIQYNLNGQPIIESR